MFINNNRNKRRPTQPADNTQNETGALPYDSNEAPEVFLADLKTTLESDVQKRSEFIGYLSRVTELLSNSQHSLHALEVLFLLSLESSNLQKMAKEEGLLTALDDMKTIGQLKQKRLATATYDKLKPHAAPVRSALSDKTNVGLMSVTTRTPSKAPFGREAKGFGAPSESSCPMPVAKQSAATITLFVEQLETEETLNVIESCLLRTKGVVSFFSDLSDQKLVVRSMLGADEIIKTIYTETHHRASTTKGSYDGAGPQYIQQQSEQGGESGWFTSLYQIISTNTATQTSHQNPGWFGANGWW